MKSKKQKPYFVESAPVMQIMIDGYEIYFQAHGLSERSLLPHRFIPEYTRLVELVQLDQGKCLEEILVLKEKCPNSPEVDNLLGFAYAQKRQVHKANSLIEETYLKYPDYFFAKINYADLLLRTKKISDVEKVFPFDEIKDNCYHRTRFHVSEYRSFMVLKSRYYIARYHKEKAYYFYERALKADPAHLSVISLERTIKKSFRFYKIISLIKRIQKNLTESSTIS
jgi:tetratricopeptide (TPR) repeat protein